MTLPVIRAGVAAAVARRTIAERRPSGRLIAVLSILYLPVGGATLLGVIGDGTVLLAFDTPAQVVFSPR